MRDYATKLALRQKGNQISRRVRPRPAKLVAAKPSHPQEQVLLDELNHRINNEFASAIAAVSLAAARSGSELVKVALTSVTELLHHYAKAHHALQMPEHNAPIDAAVYLRRLCLSISRSKFHHTNIKLMLTARSLQLQSEQCWRLGMIVNELITNAARHAFPSGSGEIRVELSRAGASVKCRVLDSGSAPANVQSGRGLKIVHELTKNLDGRFAQQLGPQGSKSILIFPYSGVSKNIREPGDETRTPQPAALARDLQKFDVVGVPRLMALQALSLTAD